MTSEDHGPHRAAASGPDEPTGTAAASRAQTPEASQTLDASQTLRASQALGDEQPAAGVSGPQGFGTPPATVIETLPPIPLQSAGVELSPRTGEPVRRASVFVAQAALWAAAAVAVVGYAIYWFEAMHRGQFNTASWITGWLDPRPGGLWSILLVVALAAVVAAMFALPCVTAYQAWCGRRYSRVLGWWALGVSVLGVLFNFVSLAAIPLTVIGVVALWLKPTEAYFDDWERLNPPETAPELPTDVYYGPLPRFQ